MNSSSTHLIPLTTINILDKNYMSQERWVTEVATWLTKYILLAILHARSGVRYPLDGFSELMREEWRKQYSLCGTILFRNGRYTKRNWIGLWVTIAILVIIYSTRYLVAKIHSAIIRWDNNLTVAASKLVTLIVSATVFAQHFVG